MAIVSGHGTAKAERLIRSMVNAVGVLLPNEHPALKAGLMRLKTVDLINEPVHGGHLIRMLFLGSDDPREDRAIFVSIPLHGATLLKTFGATAGFEEALYEEMHAGVDKAYKKFMEMEDFSKRVTPETEEQSAKDEALVDQFLADPDSFPKPKPQWQSPYVASFEVAQ